MYQIATVLIKISLIFSDSFLYVAEDEWASRPIALRDRLSLIIQLVIDHKRFTKGDLNCHQEKIPDKLRLFASGSVYVNFMTQDEADRIAAAYGPNYDRLVQIKKKYDPENVFHLNQNIKP